MSALWKLICVMIMLRVQIQMVLTYVNVKMVIAEMAWIVKVGDH